MPRLTPRIVPHGLVVIVLLLNLGCVPVRSWLSLMRDSQATAPPLPGEGKAPPGGLALADSGPVPPQSGSVQPVAYTAPPAAAAPLPPVTATRPTVVGSPLNLAPGEAPVERSLDLARRLVTVEEEKLALAAQAQQQAALLESKDRALLHAEQEVRAASAEVAKARADLQRWKQDMGTLRDRLRDAEQENVATLRSLIAWLEHALEPAKPPSQQPERLPAPEGKEPPKLREPAREFGR